MDGEEALTQTADPTPPAGEMPDAGAAAPEDQAPEERDIGSEWISLYARDDAPEVAPDLFEDALADLDRFLSAHPNGREDVLSLMAQRLGGTRDRDTWTKMNRALMAYVGELPAHLLNWAAYLNTPQRLSALDGIASSQASEFLRYLLARYGQELDAAQAAVGSVSLDDWARIDKHAFYDTIDGSSVFVLTITKMRGDVVTIEMGPDSLMNFTTHLLVMIAASGQGEIYSPERVNPFLENLGRAYSVLIPPEPDATDDGEQAATADGGG